MLPPRAKTHAKTATQLLLDSAAAARALIGGNVTLTDGRSGIVRKVGNGFLTVHLTTADGGAKVNVRQSQLVAESEPTAAPAGGYVGEQPTAESVSVWAWGGAHCFRGSFNWRYTDPLPP